MCPHESAAATSENVARLVNSFARASYAPVHLIGLGALPNGLAGAQHSADVFNILVTYHSEHKRYKHVFTNYGLT